MTADPQMIVVESLPLPAILNVQKISAKMLQEAFVRELIGPMMLATILNRFVVLNFMTRRVLLKHLKKLLITK